VYHCGSMFQGYDFVLGAKISSIQIPISALVRDALHFTCDTKLPSRWDCEVLP
jgi:hypothetical protein